MKVNTSIILLLLHLSVCSVSGQGYPCKNSMEESLKQTALILNSQSAKSLWNKHLEAPIIIIDHFNNKMFLTGIEDDSVKPIREESWNNKIPLANSFFDYDNKRYVTIIHAALMGASCEQRINLLIHEIFHTHQKSLGIENQSSHNYHMDEIQGRALLQIEMKALQQTLSGDSSSLYDALCIRAYRQNLYPNNNEDLYELNEGLAEYTGIKLSIENIKKYVKERLNYNISRGYTNAFAYYTGSAYATILDEIYPQWHNDKDLTKGLIFLIKKIKPHYFVSVNSSYTDSLLSKYDYTKILASEKQELKSFGNMTSFKELLKPKASKLYIENKGVNFTYNPNDRVISLGDAVLLRNMTLIGEWGRIEVKGGVIRMNDWTAFYLLPPTSIVLNVVKGDNYEMQLNQGWKLTEVDGIYTITN